MLTLSNVPRFSFQQQSQDELIPLELFSNENLMQRFLATVALSSRSHATSALTRAVETICRVVPRNQALAVAVPKFLELARKKAKRDYDVRPTLYHSFFVQTLHFFFNRLTEHLLGQGSTNRRRRPARALM
jgi:hypothetical protein